MAQYFSHSLTTRTTVVQSFRENVLLKMGPRSDGRLAGRVSWAHEGGVLEAINMALSAFNRHYVDRDLQRTGLSIVIVTAGTSRFNVDKNLLRLTTERVIDEGIGIDCVSLAKMPLHAVPLFRYFTSVQTLEKWKSNVDNLYVDEPEIKTGLSATDEKVEQVYALPHWIDSSFYAKHQDKPFRFDRFLPRCRMPQIQRTGIAEFENATIHLPLLADETHWLIRNDKTWQEMSKGEQRHRVWEKFDEIACGSKGMYELLDLEQRKKGLEQRPSISSLSTSNKSDASSSTSESSGTVGNVTDTQYPFMARNNIRSPIALGKKRSLGLLAMRQKVEARQQIADDGSETPKSPATPITSPVKPLPRNLLGRRRADSTASSSTVSRQTSLNIRSPSVALSSVRGPGSTSANSQGIPNDRRLASATVAQAQAGERDRSVSSSTAASALASLAAAQAKLKGPPANTSAKSSLVASASTWFNTWQKKPKAVDDTPTQSRTHSPAAPRDELPALATGPEAFSKRVEEAAASSPHSRKLSSVNGPRPPVTSLSLTPATPTAPTTTTTQPTLTSATTARPMNIGPTAAAFQVTTNDPTRDPHSLDEGSLRTYFLDAGHASAQSARMLRSRIENAKQKRRHRLNPSNPSVSSGMLLNQSRRWWNIFPRASRINDQRSVKWKSLCESTLPFVLSSRSPNFAYVRHSGLSASVLRLHPFN